MKFNKLSLNLEGIDLTYYTIGKGKPVLFLHGARVRALTFRKNLELLSQSFFVIAPDLPGHGGSSTPDKELTFKDYAKFFDLFLKRLKLKNVAVIGYSRGGGIAIHLAQISSNISKVILIDADGITKNKQNMVFVDTRRFLFYITHLKYFLVLIDLLRDYIFFLGKHISNIKSMIVMHKTPHFMDYESDNKRVIPTLILWAKDDWILPLEHAVLLCKKIPGSQLEIVDGNHDWVLYNPQLFIRKVFNFLL